MEPQPILPGLQPDAPGTQLNSHSPMAAPLLFPMAAHPSISLVAFSDGSTRAMAAASRLKIGFRYEEVEEWIGMTMAAHPSIWLPNCWETRLCLAELTRIATAGTWEVLGILLSLQLIEAFIEALHNPDVRVLADVYGDNHHVIEFCVLGSDACRSCGAPHLVPMVDLVRQRVEQLEQANNVVTFRQPHYRRNSRGIRLCDAELKLVNPFDWSVPYPTQLVRVASHNLIALEETISLLRSMKLLGQRRFFD